MSGTNELLIKQNALILIGQRPLQSLAEDTDQNAVLSARYPILKKSLLSVNPWNFTIKTVQLNNTGTPDGRWTQQYDLPSDSVIDGVIAVYPSDDERITSTLDFVIQNGKLLTNLEEIWIDYRFEVGEGDFPDHFVDLICHALASDIVLALSDDNRLADRLLAKTELLLRTAKKLDAQSAPPNNLITRFTLTEARRSGVPV